MTTSHRIHFCDSRKLAVIDPESVELVVTSPPGAYATLEHEYILILRKDPRRSFTNEDQIRNRRENAFFWEERNLWFSDLWTDPKGSSQELDNRKPRWQLSGALPANGPVETAL